LVIVINPILHTSWLDNHALTEKSNSPKYGEKIQFFAYLPNILLGIKENLNQVQKHFTFNAVVVLKKVNLNVSNDLF
jgi:hypothetical protein